MRWRANTDLTPPTIEHALVDYIAKYYTKAKKKSILYNELVGWFYRGNSACQR